MPRWEQEIPEGEERPNSALTCVLPCAHAYTHVLRAHRFTVSKRAISLVTFAKPLNIGILPTSQ